MLLLLFFFGAAFGNKGRDDLIDNRFLWFESTRLQAQILFNLLAALFEGERPVGE
jgi:hypothetical protein